MQNLVDLLFMQNLVDFIEYTWIKKKLTLMYR